MLAIANGGTTDGQLQSMCAKHHHEKTVRDSHEAAKRRRPRDEGKSTDEHVWPQEEGPDQPFSHAPDCKIVHADPSVQVPWSEIRVEFGRHAVCAASNTTMSPSPTTVSGSTRSTRRPLATRGSASSTVTDPAMLRAVLRVTRKDGYDWVECNGGDMGWQVAHSAESVG